MAAWLPARQEPDLATDFPARFRYRASDLGRYEVTLELLVKAYATLLAGPCIAVPMHTTASSLREAVVAIGLRAKRAELSGEALRFGSREITLPQMYAGDVILLSDLLDCEAAAGALLLHHKLFSHIDGELTVPSMFEDVEQVAEIRARILAASTVKVVVVLLSQQFFQHSGNLSLLVATMSEQVLGHLKVVPVVLPGFTFLGDYYEETLTRSSRSSCLDVAATKEAVKALLAIIAVDFDIRASDTIVTDQATKILRRIIGGEQLSPRSIYQRATWRWNSSSRSSCVSTPAGLGSMRSVSRLQSSEDAVEMQGSSPAQEEEKIFTLSIDIRNLRI